MDVLVPVCHPIEITRLYLYEGALPPKYFFNFAKLHIILINNTKIGINDESYGLGREKVFACGSTEFADYERIFSRRRIISQYKSLQTMSNNDNPFASALYANVCNLYRCNDINGRLVNWDEHGWLWAGLQFVWSNLSSHRFAGENWNGPLATADDMTAALLSHGASKSSIRPFGAYTLVTLDNLSFIYRVKRYKSDGDHLLVAPHITGRPFGKCGHSFIHPFSPLSDFAEAMVYFDKSVPDMQKACKAALADALTESAERSARSRTAESMLREIFGGTIPDNIRFHVAGLRKPSDLDVIRVDLRYKDGTCGTNYQVDIPLNLSKECYPYLPGMIQELSGSEPGHWYVEPFYDADTGWIPILRNRILTM